jgi:hypothetical protein
MLELLSPELLYNKQKVYHVQDGVATTISKTNLRKAVIVYDLPTETLQQPLQEMLDKLIQACKFKPEETIYLNARFTTDTSLGALQNKYNPVAVLVFGDVPISRNLAKLKKNFAYDLNGVKVVNTDSMEVLVKNDAAKKALWGVLKKMLGL